MPRCTVRAILMLAVTAAVAGCSALDLGPKPSNDVGSSAKSSQSLTDAGLDAVTPTAQGGRAGESADDVMEFPATTLPGQGTTPQTMPAATEPTTTQPTASTNPSAHVALGQGVASQPSTTGPQQGRVDVPQALDVQEAILVGLQNNVNLRVNRYNVPISRTQVESQRAAFDPTISGQIAGVQSGSPKSGVTDGPTRYSQSITGSGAITEYLPTGTTIGANISSGNSYDSPSSASTSAGLSITQKLLRGFGLDVNLASLRSAELQTKITQYELRGFSENLVATIEETYWDLAFAERQVIIVQNALEVAQAQLNSVNGFIESGRTALTERAAAAAQVEVEKEALINAKSTLEETRLRLLQLITPAGEPFWNRTLTLQTAPFIPQGVMDPVEKHMEVALHLRPEINQTKLQIQQGDLQIVQTKNGLLPELDFFVNLNKTGFASSFGPAAAALNGPDYSVQVGVSGSYDLVNRRERAQYRASVLSKEQIESSLKNLIQTVNVDVRTQYIEVERTRQQIDATRATREADETSLKVEQAKFGEGRSTSLLVSQVQQQLLSAQLSEVGAVTGHLKSLVELYRLEGSLLYRRGLEAPGGQPVEAIGGH